MGEQVAWGTEVPQRGPIPKPRYRYSVICVPIKTGFCASVCISLLKHTLKLKRHTVDLLLLHVAHTLGYFRDDIVDVPR